MNVLAVHRDTEHRFSKQSMSVIQLLEGLGVEGDAHAGLTVQHLSRVARDPDQPNLRQVHLLMSEVLDELVATGHEVGPGDLGENITTRDIDLLALSEGAVLQIGDALIEVTGLRNPCFQIDNFSHGALKVMLGKDAAGAIIRRAGVMGVVRRGGQIRPGDTVVVQAPDVHVPLQPV